MIEEKEQMEELNRQIRMGWERGRSLGRLESAFLVAFFTLIYVIINLILKHI